MWPVLVLHSDTYDKRVTRTKRSLVLPVRHLFLIVAVYYNQFINNTRIF